MNPEEYLDRLIERREHGEVQLPVINDEFAASLTAVEALAHLQEINVPPEFAGRLELSIRARVHIVAGQNGRIIPIVNHQSPARSHRFPMRRVSIAVLGIAAVLMLACIGIITASAHSLPGDLLYGVKQAEHQFTLTLADDPQDRASAQIDQLRNALADLNTVVNDGRDDDAIKLALKTVAAKTNDSLETVTALPAGPEQKAAQQDLDSVLAGEEQALRYLLDRVDWPMRVAFTRQLGVLGDPVPTVTHVMVRIQSNGTLLITLTGTNFSPHAELIIKGQPVGVVSQSTPQQLVAVISSSEWSRGTHAFGVLNPDGTAAQMVLNGDDNEHPEQDSDHNRYGTPQPTNDSGE